MEKVLRKMEQKEFEEYKGSSKTILFKVFKIYFEFFLKQNRMSRNWQIKHSHFS